MKARHELNISLYNKKANGSEKESPPNDYLPIRLGDTDAVREYLESKKISLFGSHKNFSENALKNLIYRFLIEATEISKIAVCAGMSRDEADALAEIYIRKADICKDEKNLSEIFADMCLDFAERINEITADTIASPHIRKCKAYIYGNLNADLSVKGLAQLTGLNPTYLSELFSKETGTTVKKFVTHAKTDTAQNLLRYTKKSFIEIAVSLGYSSQSAFIRSFKKETGQTPKKYREMF